MKKKFKGFTLVELVIVMAIFTILLVGVMALVDPVAKLMKKTNVQESNAASTDNIKRYLEGNLRYAEAITVHSGGLTQYDSAVGWGAVPGDKNEQLRKSVQNFLNDYYKNLSNSTHAPLSGNVRVMVIDNDGSYDMNGDGAPDGVPGQIYEYLVPVTAGYTYFDYDSVGGVMTGRKTDPVSGEFVSRNVDPVVSATPFNAPKAAINNVYYEHYGFDITVGYNQLTPIQPAPAAFADPGTNYYAKLTPQTDASGATYRFDNNMFSFTIVTYKKDGGKLLGDVDDDTTTPDEKAFLSPCYAANSTMSLVNINSVFKDGTKYYGPERCGVYSDVNKNTVDLKGPGGVILADGEPDYVQLNSVPDQLPQNRERTNCINDPNNEVADTDNNIYIIYTVTGDLK